MLLLDERRATCTVGTCVASIGGGAVAVKDFGYWRETADLARKRKQKWREDKCGGRGSDVAAKRTDERYFLDLSWRAYTWQ